MKRKTIIIGVGHVGSHAASLLVSHGICTAAKGTAFYQKIKNIF